MKLKIELKLIMSKLQTLRRFKYLTMEKYSCVLLLAILGIFAVRNFLVPLFADDYSYAFIWNGKDKGNLMNGIGKRERVKSVKDIFISQYSHYLTWSGRFTAHFLIQFFILIGKKFFNIINTIAFVVLIFLIYKLGIIENGKTGFEFVSSDLVFWILFCYWFCIPSLLITSFWICGSCVYMFMAVLQCSFIIPYALNYFNPCDFNIGFMIVLGFLAGFSNEFGGAGVFFFTLGCIISSFVSNYNYISSWQVLGFLAFCAGYAALIFAPGNFVHVQLLREQFPDYLIPKESYMKKEMFTKNFLSGFLPVILRAWIIFIPIIHYFFKNGFDLRGVYIFILAVSGIFSLSVMMFSPDFPERGGYSAVIFLLIASVSALQDVIFPNWLKYLAMVILFSDMALCVYSDFDFSRQIKNIIRLAEEQKHNDSIFIPNIRSSKVAIITRWRALNESALWAGGFEESPEGNTNIMFAQYYDYGLKKIILKGSN